MAMPLQTNPTVNLNTLEDPDPSVVNLNTDDSISNIPSVETAQNRARKYMFSMPGLAVPYEKLLEDISNGNEDSVRNYAASKVREQKLNRANEAALEAAKRKGSPLTPEEGEYIMSLAADNYETDPRSVFEVSYAKEYLQYLDMAFPDTVNVYKQASEQFPDQMEAVKRESLDILTKRQIAIKQYEDAVEVAQKQSWVGWGADLLKNVVHFYPSAKLRGNVPGVGYFEGGFLGSNLRAQADALMKTKDVKQFNDTFTSIMDRLKNDNPTLAVEFAKTFVDYSTSDEIVNNLSEIIDIATAPTGLSFRKAGQKAVKPVTKEQKQLLDQGIEAVKDVVKSDKGLGPEKAVIQEASGDVGEAAITRAVKNLDEDFTGGFKDTNRLVEPLMTSFRSDLQTIQQNAGRLSREALVRIENSYYSLEDNLTTLLSRGLRVDRVPELTDRTVQLRLLKEKFADMYPGMDNTLLDQGIRLVKGVNTREYVYDFGKPGAELFQTWTVANNWAKANGLKGYNVEKKGNGFYVRVVSPLDETDPLVRKVLNTTDPTEIPDNFMKGFFDWLRTPEETLSLAEREARKSATYPIAPWNKFLQETTREIKKLARKAPNNWQDLQRTLEYARTAPDPGTGQLGYFFRSPLEIEDFYNRHFHRMPQDIETEAYFAYTRAYEVDRQLRNLAVNRNLNRLGIQKITLTHVDENGKVVDGLSFNGKIVKDLPFTDNAIVIMGNKLGEETVKVFPNPTKAFKDLQKKVKSGEISAVEIHDRGQRPLSGMGKVGSERVAYVLTNNLKTAAIDFEQVPRRGGGHWAYDYGFYLKQANIVAERVGKAFKHWYEGDTTIMPISVRAMGEDAAKHLNEIRILLKNKNVAGAKAYAEKHFFVEFKDIQKWFQPRTVNGVRERAMLSLDEPIQLVPRGSKIIDMNNDLQTRYAKTLKNGEHDGLARTNSVEFTQERNSYELQTIYNSGTADNPLYKFEPARFIDPIKTMERSLTKIVNSTFLDDYKIMSVEHWLKNAEQWLDVPRGSVWDAPFNHFYHTKYKANTPPEVVQQLNTMKKNMENLLGTPSTTDTLLYSAASKLADTVYRKTGSSKPLGIDPAWVLPKLTDPFRFIRGVTFHASMGLFAIPQLFVQLNTFTNIAAISSMKYAGPGTMAAMMAGWARINKHPNIIAELDKKMAQLNIPGASKWKPGEFKEAYETLDAVGFGIVQGEYSLRDDIFRPNIVSSRGREFLDLGASFFTMGERSVRYGAWFTAFKEFRDAKPFGRLTQQDTRQILERADTLSMNMSRASNSRIHEGVFSIPTQFLTYGIRAAELFWGKRLGETTTERMLTRGRILAWNAALYGAPMSIGVVGFPAGDFLKEALIKNYGYSPGLDNWATSAVMEGLPALGIALATATGSGNTDGTWFNFGERYGVGGFETIREALRGDKDMFELIGGAAFSKFKGTISHADGFTRAMMSMIADDGEAYPPTMQDFIDIFREISSVHATLRTVAALNSGEWLSKKGMKLADVTAGEALTSFLTGLQPNTVSDSQLILNLSKDQKNLEKYVSERFQIEFRKGLRAVQNNDPEMANKYFTRANTLTKIGGMRPDMMPDLLSKAMKGNESLADSAYWNFFIKNAPDEMKDTYLNAYQRRQGNTQ